MAHLLWINFPQERRSWRPLHIAPMFHHLNFSDIWKRSGPRAQHRVDSGARVVLDGGWVFSCPASLAAVGLKFGAAVAGFSRDGKAKSKERQGKDGGTRRDFLELTLSHMSRSVVWVWVPGQKGCSHHMISYHPAGFMLKLLVGVHTELPSDCRGGCMGSLQFNYATSIWFETPSYTSIYSCGCHPAEWICDWLIDLESRKR